MKKSTTMNLEIIETNRLNLKIVSYETMNYIFKNFKKNKIKTILGHRSEKDYEKEEKKHIEGYSSYNRRFILFLLIEKGSDKIIGRCGLHNWNMENKRAEIGYFMNDESYKNKGLMTEAVYATIDYGFNIMKLNRIESLVGIENIPSLRIMKKLNFKKEGQLRQYFYNSDKFEDSILFSKLFNEYTMK